MNCTQEAFRHPSLVHTVGVRDVVSVCDDPVHQRNHPTHRRATVSANGAMGVGVVWVCCSFSSLGWGLRSFLTPGTCAGVVGGPRQVCVWWDRHGLVPRYWKANSWLRMMMERCKYGGVSCNRAEAELCGDRIINTLHSTAGWRADVAAMTQLVQDKRAGGTLVLPRKGSRPPNTCSSDNKNSRKR